MATRKRRSSSKRRTHRARAHNPINPTRRRKSTTHRRRRHSVFARSRRRNPINPTRRRRIGRRRHHRNPIHAASGEIINYTVAGLAQGIAGPIIGKFVGGYLPFGQYNAAALSFGTGWVLSKVFGMFGATRRFSHAALVFGAATGAMQILQPIVARTVAGATAPAAGMSGPYSGYRGRGMRGIGVVTGIPPAIVPPPMPPPQQQGMNGMAMRPGNYGYAR